MTKRRWENPECPAEMTPIGAAANPHATVHHTGVQASATHPPDAGRAKPRRVACRSGGSTKRALDLYQFGIRGGGNFNRNGYPQGAFTVSMNKPAALCRTTPVFV